jgi:hypothetical protein
VTASDQSQGRSSHGPTMPVLMDNYEEEGEYTMTCSPSSVQDNTTFLKPRLRKELLQVQQQQQHAPQQQHQPEPVRRPPLKNLFTRRDHIRRVLQERKNVSTANTSNTTTNKNISISTTTKAAFAPPKQQEQGGRQLTGGYMIPRHKPPSPPPQEEKNSLSPRGRLDARYHRPPLSPQRPPLSPRGRC